MASKPAINADDLPVWPSDPEAQRIMAAKLKLTPKELAQIQVGDCIAGEPDGE